ncbi:ribosomal protein S7 domain-containing protein [Diplogelasinospora grovesii]|uniref:Small ribosomal subunit protein uS7m n=1 Tax=Diplogelasinospora grovesii TaxID=303347 RepID=A0AAN6S936_9PEZI|nr:ribosomal protein S7 domain-containing protein [Diplogelasinospora grovesii]
MPPRLNTLTAVCRNLTIRSRPLAQWPAQPCIAVAAPRTITTTPSQTRNQNKPNVKELSRTTKRWSSTTSSSEGQLETTSAENEAALSQLQMVAYGLNPFDVSVEGHKYGLPELPIPSEMHMKHRYNPVVDQITRLLMQDGKLSKAQRDMAIILNYLRTSPPPKLNPARPLLPGAPPASHLPLDPVLYLTLAIDSVAPLIRVRALKGMAGGGFSLDVPVPLAARQRRRIAFQWILDVVNKKKSKGSGRTMFPHRVAEEIVAVVEGRSGVWDKRQQLHKAGTTARANLNSPNLRRKRKSF